MPNVTATPFWELRFDAEGHVDTAQRDALRDGVTAENITDLVCFSHGWNNDHATATRLYDRFLAPFPQLLSDAQSQAKVGYVGIFWPSMRWTDEPIPDFAPEEAAGVSADDGTAAVGAAAAAPVEAPQGLDEATRAALSEVFPGQDARIARLGELLEDRPDNEAELAEFFTLTRALLTDERGDADDGDDAGSVPAMLGEAADPKHVCREFAAQLTLLGVRQPEADDTAAFGGLSQLWHGAREVLRQATYFEMKKRAGTVGRQGLGPALADLQRAAPEIRVHLVGHSFGARVVSFALAGLPATVSPVNSVVLLQGAFSHFAFADALPHDRDRGGALRRMQQRVDGPIVTCFSSHDSAVGTLYPMASWLSRDDAAALPWREQRWGAIGHDGAQAVDATATAIGPASPATRYPFSPGRFTNIDASNVVRRGRPPSGAHSDICHPELAWVVVKAGQLVG